MTGFSMRDAGDSKIQESQGPRLSRDGEISP